jgi:uncharacterized protein YjiS (DUF1127 family)
MPEKNMRTLSSTTARLQSVATPPNPLTNLIATLQLWWVAYLGWRIERQATLQLEAMNDRELHDIGLRRCEIEGAVKGELNGARHDACPLIASGAANVRNLASAGTRCARRAVMSPAQFIALVAGWGVGLVLLLFISALVRYFS